MSIATLHEIKSGVSSLVTFLTPMFLMRSFSLRSDDRQISLGLLRTRTLVLHSSATMRKRHEHGWSVSFVERTLSGIDFGSETRVAAGTEVCTSGSTDEVRDQNRREGFRKVNEPHRWAFFDRGRSFFASPVLGPVYTFLAWHLASLFVTVGRAHGARVCLFGCRGDDS